MLFLSPLMAVILDPTSSMNFRLSGAHAPKVSLATGMKIKSFVRPMYLATGCFPSSLERPTSSVVEVTWADPKALSMMSLTCVCLGYVPFAFLQDMYDTPWGPDGRRPSNMECPELSVHGSNLKTL